jgi:hypothetical protein
LEIRYKAALAEPSPEVWSHFLDTCTKYAKNKPTLWKDAFFIITTPRVNGPEDQFTDAQCPGEIVQEILKKLLDENLMEPLPILDRMCHTHIKLGTARQFLTKILDRKDIEEDKEESKKLLNKTDDVRKRIEDIRTKSVLIQYYLILTFDHCDNFLYIKYNTISDRLHSKVSDAMHVLKNWIFRLFTFSVCIHSTNSKQNNILIYDSSNLLNYFVFCAVVLIVMLRMKRIVQYAFKNTRIVQI